MAYSALRHAQLLGCARKTFMPGGGFKGLERVQRRQMRAHRELSAVHEKNWGRPEKRCFAGQALPALLTRTAIRNDVIWRPFDVNAFQQRRPTNAHPAPQGTQRSSNWLMAEAAG